MVPAFALNSGSLYRNISRGTIGACYDCRAEVNGDYAGSDEGQLEKLEYELFYIQNQSIFLDLYILLKTVQTVLFRPGE